jgi:predicted TPR repeat methyltransferase
MLAATSGVDTPERAAPEYVRHMFDLLAADFDRHLGELGYRAPELVTERLRSRLDAGFRPDVLDAGCGTGLAGPLLRKFSNRVVGVDLSPGMIEKAHARGTYDELVVQEISEFMRSRPDTFDVVICVDTFIYFGVIDEPLRAARTCLHPRGLLAFTTECLEDSAPYRLQSHGRYAHSESYIRQTTAQTGFTEVTLETRAIRREHGKDVPGYVVLAQAESA